MRRIQSYQIPDPAVIEQARALESACNSYDNLKVSLYFDSSLNFSPEIPSLFALFEDDALIAAVTMFTPRTNEAELVGLTHPGFRRTGAFRALIASAAQQAAAFGIPELLFVCEPNSVSGVAALRSMGVSLENTEYSLRFDRAFRPESPPVLQGLTLRRAGGDDLDVLSSVSGASFQEDPEHARQMISRVIVSDDRAQYLALLNGIPVGIVSTGINNGQMTIYGLGVLPSMQGKGVGRGILSLLLAEVLPVHAGEVLIEVDNANAGALHLYLSSGFVLQASFGYYRAKTERFLPRQ